jgi:hypothetical protein
MIIEWILSLLVVWFFPVLFSLFNPFFVPISSYLLARRAFLAIIASYITGLLRDIFLATPRFGMLGASSLFSSLIALGVCFYFPLEGFWGACIIVSVLTLADALFSAGLGAFLCDHAYFSWKTLFIALFFSSAWTLLAKGIPLLLNFLSLRRQHRDTNS